MVTGSARRRMVGARSSARKARNSTFMSVLARAGLAARGVMYILIGVIAVRIAFSSSGQKAESTGAVRLVAKTPFGSALLWLLAIGFAGLTLWRLSEAIWGSSGPDGRKPAKRLAAAARAILYGFVTFGIFKYALGLGAPSSSNTQSQDLTARAMQLPGGQVLVAIAGIAIVAAGLYIAYEAWKKKFLRQMRMGSARPATRKTVQRLGQAGGIARGTVFATAGIFLVVAAVNANPGQAKGIDSALRALAHTPLGPWLLVLVALGLVTFGVFSLCMARWLDA
jgi:Domain of Unknown Function (DUF1206)